MQPHSPAGADADPSEPSLHPYEALTPDVVLDALATLDLHGDGRLQALSSYENRVYQIHLEDRSAVVAKFYRPGRWSEVQILEEHAFSAELTAAEVPAVAPLELHGATLHQHAGFAFSVSPYRGGRPPELDDFEVLEWIGRFLARIHTVGAKRPFESRPALDLQSFGTASRDWLLGNEKIPLDVQRMWETACNEALDMIAKTALATDAQGRFGSEFKSLRLHGDCHPGNILWTPTDRPGGGPHFVDLDDARTGFAVQDLWMLLSGDRAQRTGQLSGLLEGYEQFRSFDRSELALIEPLRTLRLIHYSAWLARRWEDPIFPINFPWFGSSDYWKGQVLMLQEQCEQMAEEPLYA
jgi:Ser/Thr protein kinase RdoA (MazF antagonist)